MSKISRITSHTNVRLNDLSYMPEARGIGPWQASQDRGPPGGPAVPEGELENFLEAGGGKALSDQD